MFVADLPEGTKDDDLRALFKDVRAFSILYYKAPHQYQCGAIREIKMTQLPNSLVATVEFMERVRTGVLMMPVQRSGNV